MFRIPQSRYFFVVFLYIFKALAQYELKNEYNYATIWNNFTRV